MERAVVAIASANVWVLVLKEREMIIGYWCSGLRAWVVTASDDGITIWQNVDAAQMYRARNLSYLLRAQIVSAGENC